MKPRLHGVLSASEVPAADRFSTPGHSAARESITRGGIGTPPAGVGARLRAVRSRRRRSGALLAAIGPGLLVASTGVGAGDPATASIAGEHSNGPLATGVLLACLALSALFGYLQIR